MFSKSVHSHLIGASQNVVCCCISYYKYKHSYSLVFSKLVHSHLKCAVYIRVLKEFCGGYINT